MKKTFLQMVSLCMVIALLTGCSSDTKNDTKKEIKKESKQSEAPDAKISVTEGTYDEYLECIVADGVCYEIKDEAYAAVTGYDGEQENIDIPSTLTYEGKDYPVEAINDEAFSYNTVLTKLTLPDSLKSIGKEAFCSCSSLVSVEIPDGVTTLGTGIFYDCTELTSCIIGKGITNLPNEMFTNCYALADITLPDTLVAIGEEVFWACENIKQMTLPESVVTMGQRAFYGSGIENFTILAKGVTVTEDMLDGLDELQTLYIDEALVETAKKCVHVDVSVEALK